MPLIARAGIREVRDGEQYWEKVEREPGVYRFPAPFTGYMAALADHEVAPLIVLSFANHLYDRGLTPFSADGREGYARYGRAVLDHYGSQIRAVNLNKFNGSFCQDRARTIGRPPTSTCSSRPIAPSRRRIRTSPSLAASRRTYRYPTSRPCSRRAVST